VQFQNFRGADVTEALSQVRTVLGPDAVIRATRRVPGGSPLDRGYVEIEAARGEAPAHAARSESAEPRVRPARLGETRARMDTRTSRATPAAAPVARAVATAKAGPVSDVNREIAELKAAVEALQAACTPRARALGYLHSAGVEGTLANELAAAVPRSAKGNLASGPWLRKAVGERLRIESSLIARPGQQLLACVGPTGAGKTTTLAKLAAKARLDLGRSVGVISLDTFRVGAVEQWQRYARLIGLPFYAARDADEFGRALSSMDTEILLVDTEGALPGDPLPMQRLAGSLERAAGWDKHVMLVVPAWLRGGDVDRLARSYQAPRPTAVVATKLDEASRVGGLLHACLPEGTPLAYLCDGPRVPEDIAEASVETLVEHIFPSELPS
jgi:flagellar biosynthesis protein FlhF